MKYSDLISFNPIEDVIQLTTADDANRAKEYVNCLLYTSEGTVTTVLNAVRMA